MKVSDRTIKLTATALGLGNLPVAPGTYGSAGAAVVYLVVRLLLPPAAAAATLGALVLAAVVAGLASCPRAMELYESKDPGSFVMDEVAGLWLTGLLFWGWGPVSATLGVFAVFRVFDIWKPPPVCTAEKLPRAWGVMADDLVAGVYGAAVLWLALYCGLAPAF